MELNTRQRHESDLSAAILIWLDDYRQQLPDGLNWFALALDMAKAMERSLEEAFTSAALQLAGEVGIASQLIDQRGKEWAEQYARALAEEIVRSTRDRLNPETIDQLFGRERADGIAITEITRAITAGEALILGMAMEAGQTLTGIWHTEADAQVCEVCRPLHRTPPEVWQRVTPSGPPAHPRCRCWLDYERTKA